MHAAALAPALAPALEGFDQLLYRWVHVVAGVGWVGILFFLNLALAPAQAALERETRRRLVPELLPRALFWFRWAAAFTWVSGVALLMKLYYFGPFATADGVAPSFASWAPVFAGLFLGFAVYDVALELLRTRWPAAGWMLLAALALGFSWILDGWLGWSRRAVFLHVGALYGTLMAANVWLRIWPAQRRIVTAVKNGQEPDPLDPARAAQRSRHNLAMSIPLILLMVGVHQAELLALEPWPGVLGGILLLGYLTALALLEGAKHVRGA